MGRQRTHPPFVTFSGGGSRRRRRSTRRRKSNRRRKRQRGGGFLSPLLPVVKVGKKVAPIVGKTLVKERFGDM